MHRPWEKRRCTGNTGSPGVLGESSACQWTTAHASQGSTHVSSVFIQTTHAFELEAADSTHDMHTLPTLAPRRESMAQLRSVVLAVHVTFLAVKSMTADFVSLHQLLSREREPAVSVCTFDAAVSGTATGLHVCLKVNLGTKMLLEG